MSKDPNSESLKKARQYLASCQQNGNWPYKKDGSPSIEATAWSVIALAGDKDTSQTVEPAITWLLGVQNPDGGYSTCPNATPSDWNTAPALLAFNTVKKNLSSQPNKQALDDAMERACSWLASNVIDLYTPLGKVVYFLLQGEASYSYPRGWPWTPGTYHWVEPTSYALMALKQMAGACKLAPDIVNRADNYLLAYACASGGWNYGEKTRGLEKLPASRMNTAEALIALQDKSGNPKLTAGLDYLHQAINYSPSPLTLSWTILAKQIYGLDTETDRKQLIGLQEQDGSFCGQVLPTALAALAIACPSEGNRLRFA